MISVWIVALSILNAGREAESPRSGYGSSAPDSQPEVDLGLDGKSSSTRFGMATKSHSSPLAA